QCWRGRQNPSSLYQGIAQGTVKPGKDAELPEIYDLIPRDPALLREMIHSETVTDFTVILFACSRF
ncbi:MAG TPA: hypothetical protein PKG82_12820, partial [Myxococcota bacterium]|nr:hypothetical protein [Myxococcota bacterium]